MYEPRLYTQRLILRPILFPDFQNLCVGMNDTRVTRWLSSSRQIHVMDVAVWFSAAEKRGMHWIIFEREEKYFIGYVGISYVAEGSELSYWVLPEFWNQGYITEALQTVLSWCKEVKEVYPVRAEVSIENKPSERVLLKLGFNYEYNSEFRKDGNIKLKSEVFVKSL